jgi:hypothetical protein
VTRDLERDNVDHEAWSMAIRILEPGRGDVAGRFLLRLCVSLAKADGAPFLWVPAVRLLCCGTGVRSLGGRYDRGRRRNRVSKGA